MARLYSRATRTVAALMLSPARVMTLSVVGVGLAVFAGQNLPRGRRNIDASPLAGGTPADNSQPAPANTPNSTARNSDG